MALRPFHSPLLPLRPLSSLQPSVPSTALWSFCSLCPIYGPLLPLKLLLLIRPSARSAVLYPLCGTLCLSQLSVPSATLCPLNCPLFFLRPSISSLAIYPIYVSLYPLRSFASLRYVCSLSSLSVLWWQNSETSETNPLVSQFFYYYFKHDYHDHCNHKHCNLRSCKILSDNRENHDYHWSEKSSDNRDNHIQQEEMIVFRAKLETQFRISPAYCSIVMWSLSFFPWLCQIESWRFRFSIWSDYTGIST